MTSRLAWVSIVACALLVSVCTVHQDNGTPTLTGPSELAQPPADKPTALFTISPSPVNLNVPTTLDASPSCLGAADTKGVCQPSSALAFTKYEWKFSDGSSAPSQKIVSHTFAATGTVSVTLTVTNDHGLSASSTQAVTVGTIVAPKVDFVFSPTQPVILQDVQFNASASSTAPGHTLVSYSWDFGDGTRKAGVTSTHDFASAGIYSVTLTVTDDTGQTATTSKSVTVGTGNPVPVFTVSPPSPINGVRAIFDASGTTTSGGATVVAYSWSFGDGATSLVGPVTSYPYPLAGTYVVRLTVTDSLGRSGTATVTVTVK